MSTEWTQAEETALRRFAAGEKLGQSARRSLNKVMRKIKADRRYIASGAMDENLEMRRQYLEQEYARSGGRLTGPAGGGASSFAPPRSPAGGSAVEPPAGGVGALVPRFDGRSASHADLREKLRLLGLDPAVLPENRPMSPAEQRRERTTTPSAAITFERHLADRRRAVKQTEREKQVATDFDGRTAEPAAVAGRLKALGIHDLAIETGLRPVGSVLDPDWRGNPVTKGGGGQVVPKGVLTEAQLAAQRQDARLVAEARAGKPIDARGFSGEEAFKRFLIARGYASPTSWGPATRVPSRR